MRINTDTTAKPNLAEEAALLKALADPTRLRLAVVLSVNGETCVCTLAQGLNEPEYKISRHLGILRSAGLVEARRKGTWMYYKLAKPRNPLEKCLQECFRDSLAGHKSMAAALVCLKEANCDKGEKP
jgi:DNA-binding transcriptional ArsR family regulator